MEGASLGDEVVVVDSGEEDGECIKSLPKSVDGWSDIDLDGLEDEVTDGWADNNNLDGVTVGFLLGGLDGV